MSFMDTVGKLAGMLQSNPEQASKAAQAHVNETDPHELGDQLNSSVGTLDTASVMKLGQTLLSTFTDSQHYQGDGEHAAEAAGVSPNDVAAGSPSAVESLINYAKSNPQVLQAAATAFMSKNPEALTQLAPEMLQGIMGKLGH